MRKNSYPPEFRRQMVELVRSGRTAEELSREFEPSPGAIRNGSGKPTWTKGGAKTGPRRTSGRSSGGCAETAA